MATYAVGPGKAYTTIQAAITAAGAASDLDALIPVDAGTYTENLDLKKWAGGTTNCVPVSIYAADPNNRPTIVCTTGSYGILANAPTLGAGNRQPTFTNLIWSGGTASTYLVYSAGGVPLKFIGCDFLSVMYGKTLFYLPYGGTSTSYQWVIDRCWFYVTAQIIFNNSGGYGLIIGNRFRWANGAQVMIQSGYSTWNAYNNSVVSSANGGTLFIVGNAKNNAVKVNTGTAPTRVFDCVQVYDYNCTVGWNGTNSGTNGGHNLVGQEPGFAAADTGNFAITSSSPCYNAGTSLADVTVDYVGTARPQGVALDIGAFELIATTTVSGVTVLSSTSIRLDLTASVGSDATWASAGNFTITSGTGAAVTVSTATASGNPGSSITLVTTEHTNGATYTIAWAGVANVTSGSTTYTGQGVAPTIQTAVFTSASTFRLVFSEAMTNNAALTTVTNYTLTPTAGAGFNPTAATRINATTVDLTIDRSLGAATGTITVANLTDLGGNAPSPASVAIAVWATTITGATGRLEGRASFVRLTFAAPIYRHATSWVAGAVSISPYLRPAYYGVDASPANYLDIITSDSTTGTTYTITTTGLVGLTNGAWTFDGGNPPTSAGVDAGEPPRIAYFTGPAGESY